MWKLTCTERYTCGGAPESRGASGDALRRVGRRRALHHCLSALWIRHYWSRLRRVLHHGSKLRGQISTAGTAWKRLHASDVGSGGRTVPNSLPCCRVHVVRAVAGRVEFFNPPSRQRRTTGGSGRGRGSWGRCRARSRCSNGACRTLPNSLPCCRVHVVRAVAGRVEFLNPPSR
jgi:hypothetical protein